MKNIYKYIGILVLSLCVSSCLFGQQKGIIKGGLNLDNFPEVSFVYHTNSPDQLDDSDFSSLKESGESRTFTVNRLSNTNVDQPQNILILWEDMASNGTAQFEFTRKTLLGFFNNVLRQIAGAPKANIKAISTPTSNQAVSVSNAPIEIVAS